MTDVELIEIAKDSILLTLEISLPVMMVGLVVGVLVALIQALTQIQEMTLVFVPKIVAIFAVIFFLFPIFATTMQGFMEEIATRIINID